MQQEPRGRESIPGSDYVTRGPRRRWAPWRPTHDYLLSLVLRIAIQAQEAVKVAAGVKGKNLFMPIRVAVVGQPHGSELKMVVPLLAKSSLLKRADQALGALKS